MRATRRRGGSHPLTRLGLVFLFAAFLVPAFAPTAAAQATATDTGEAAEATLTVTVEGEGEVFSSPEGIACPATCEATFQVGETVTLTASEGIGEFRGWSGACAEAAGTECTLAVAGNVTAGAAFTSPQPPPPPPPEPPGPGPEPPGPPPPPGQLLARIDDILAALPLANIAFNVPKALEVGQRTVIELRMSGRRPIRQLKQEITALGEREGARIRVSDQVEARLTGLGFEIRPLTPERQAVSGEGVTEWGWAISPTESGTLTLHLTVSAVIDVRGAQSTHTIETYERAMNVRVTWPDRVQSFIKGNWQWLWATLLAPLGAWFWRRRARGSSEGNAGNGGGGSGKVRRRRKRKARSRRKQDPPS